MLPPVVVRFVGEQVEGLGSGLSMLPMLRRSSVRTNSLRARRFPAFGALDAFLPGPW